MLQVETIRHHLPDHSDLEICSVDGFQGREKEAIILSLVRSNPRGATGFLAQSRRLNVAITRPRRLLVCVCDTETLQSDPFLKRMCAHMADKGEYLSGALFAECLPVLSERPRGNPSSQHTPGAGKGRGKRAARGGRPGGAPARGAREGEEGRVGQDGAKGAGQHTSETEIDALLAEVRAFAAEKVEELALPTTLSSFARLKVHEEAQKLQIEHLSVGVAPHRQLVLRKTTSQGSKGQHVDVEEGLGGASRKEGTCVLKPEALPQAGPGSVQEGRPDGDGGECPPGAGVDTADTAEGGGSSEEASSPVHRAAQGVPEGLGVRLGQRGRHNSSLPPRWIQEKEEAKAGSHDSLCGRHCR